MIGTPHWDFASRDGGSLESGGNGRRLPLLLLLGDVGAVVVVALHYLGHVNAPLPHYSDQ